MRTTLLLIFTAFTLATQAQTSVYHPFPDSDAVWNVSWGYQDPGPPVCTEETNFSYIINGDTLINSIKYHKIYSPYCNFVAQGFCGVFPTCGGLGAFRQDTTLRKVWFVATGTTNEYLLYDFNLHVGDTINLPNSGCSKSIIATIDSVLIGNNYRKRWILSEGNLSEIIEGIGSTNGVLQNLCVFCFEECTELLCFQQNGKTLYSNSTNSCSVITSVNNISKKNTTVTLFPNPFHSSAMLTTNVEKSELKIYNTLGMLVQEEKINTTSTTINRNSLSNGIYFYQLVSENGQIASGKFVIE